jgi:hypothetical protein
MTGSGEWGPWVTHDGKGCPCAGRLVTAMLRDRTVVVGVATSEPHPVTGNACDWASVAKWRRHKVVVRYRIHRPAALRELIRLAAEPYAPPAPARRVEEVA